MDTSAADHYDPLSKALHWVTAIVVPIAFALGPGGFGRLMRQGVDPATRPDILWHESLGMLVLAITLLRLVWGAVRPRVPPHATSGWMQPASRLVRSALWALLLMLPVTAILTLSSEVHPLTLLGGVRIDPVPPVAPSVVLQLADWGHVHKLLGDAIVWLAGLHAVAALYHQYVLRDGLLSTMLPRHASLRQHAFSNDHVQKSDDRGTRP